MKVYDDYGQSPYGWNVAATLTLEDDGRFVYEELWTDYTNASIGGSALGRWRRREGGAVVFHAESVEGSMYHPWSAGGEMEAVERGDALDFGRNTLRIRPSREVVAPTPERTKTAAPERALVTRASARTHSPRVATPVAGRLFARFEPREPSPETAARIRRRVDELPASRNPDWIKRLCKENGAIPLHSTQIYLWVLRPDGRLLCIDHESFARRAESETDPLTAYAVLTQGAHDYPELHELLAPPPEGVRQCELCGGVGWTEAQPPAKGTEACLRCQCLGWYVRGTPG
jgi:hypothetical protein